MLIWKILKQSVSGFIAHEALSRGAAIAFYIVTSLAPVLLIVVAVAGLVFGQDAVRGSLVKELGGLFGKESGELIQAMLASASDKPSSTLASIFGVLMVIVTASGVFSEMQAALNRTWDVDSSDQPWFSLIKTRAASLGLVAALGFLLMVSLAASAALSAFGNYMGAHTAFAPIILSLLNTIISLLLFTLLFAAIFKVLPDIPIGWRDVGIGAFVTAVLFTIGKFSNRLVPRDDCCQFWIWGGGSSYSHSSMVVLFSSDIPVRSRNHTRSGWPAAKEACALGEASARTSTRSRAGHRTRLLTGAGQMGRSIGELQGSPGGSRRKKHSARPLATGRAATRP